MRTRTYEPLTSEQQQHVADRVPLAKWIAARFHWHSEVDRDDALQEANLLLCRPGGRYGRGLVTRLHFQVVRTWSRQRRRHREAGLDHDPPDRPERPDVDDLIAELLPSELARLRWLARRCDVAWPLDL